MLELQIFQIIKYIFLAIAGIVFIVLFFVAAGYGRFNSKKWGPQMDNRLGWVIMEAVSPVVFFILFLAGDRAGNTLAIVFLLIWELHYVQRAFIYPLLIRGRKTIPITIVAMGMTFNLVNSYIQGRYLFALSDPYPLSWLTDFRFVSGSIIFILGYIINLHSDYILRKLRKPGDTGYYIPYGGMFRFVTSPNYLGEIMEWTGWALLTWSLIGLIFALWTIANLVPRAVTYHKWYHENFPDYPENREAIIPFII